MSENFGDLLAARVADVPTMLALPAATELPFLRLPQGSMPNSR